MIFSTRVALVANKITLRAAERSTNAKITELEEKGHTIVLVNTAAYPVPDDTDPRASKLLWLSVITYRVDESKLKPERADRVVVYEE